ncbi:MULTISPECIES: threonine/serine exporter family protein [Clostridium]|uniref:Threonine/Serine exporter ThrE domain-containing protein n=2 Tax=Clostridium TaxID=1485 RepID=A0A151ART2_9CLOT|nr:MULTISPECIES: threonine/serine exporter family protein [Clostridium]KYH30097.1 hypothetical protein CLCOL_00350 [Clostridium colicanis DSM 13634]MBE6044673.1 threonine/serine exporter [Clostridium thermopalmarium]PRR75405.1 hypothetical protein CPAL_05940 [Clostridium thermopalmarium DSM 5974]PVZ24307.1 uncharacterized membrane protein YjjB (DUF3815 family) [Clostridium thermopalmarium DSM 5974]
MILNSIYALLSSLGFAFLFNIRGKNLIFTSFGGAIGWFLYLLFINHSFSKVFALFIASISVSVYSEIMARVLKSPVTIFLICGIIPLVPGAGMYYTMYEITMGNINASLSIGLETISSAGAIAVATVLVASTTKVIVMLKKAHNA